MRKKIKSMKMNIRYFSVLVFLLMLCFVLASCGEDGAQEPVQEQNADADTEVSEKKPSPQPVSTDDIAFMVGDEPVTRTEIMLYSRPQIEEYGIVYGNDVWDLVLDETGTTVGTRFKEEIMKQIIYVKIVCAQAGSLGISLDEDESLDVLLETEDYLANFTSAELKENGITYDLVEKIYKENKLANKIYEILTLNIDTSVTEDEVRNMNLEYIFINKMYRDANGNQREYTDEEKRDVVNKAQAFLDELRAMPDLESIAALDQDQYRVTKLIGDKDDITQKTNTQIAKLAFGLSQGEFSDIFQDEYGWYILYCVDESDEAATEAATIRILEQRQQELFDESYAEWEKNTTIRINYEVWNNLNLY